MVWHAHGVQASHPWWKVLLSTFAHTPLPGMPSPQWLLFNSSTPSLPASQESSIPLSLLLYLCFMEVHSCSLFAHHGFLEINTKPYPSSCSRAPSPGPVWDRFTINISWVHQWLLVRNKRFPKCRSAVLETNLFFKEVILQIPQFSNMVQGYAVLAVNVKLSSCQV